MPFDGNHVSENKRLLIKAKGYIDSPEKWCQGAYYHRGRMCTANALHKAVTDKHYTSMYSSDVPKDKEVELGRLLMSTDGGPYWQHICQFNNAKTHQQLMEVFDKAISVA